LAQPRGSPHPSPGDELPEGLLGNDVPGFRIQYPCNNLLDTVASAVEAEIDSEHLDRLADAWYEAHRMPIDERRQRMARMRG
jgi:trehalose-6-phosphate synthase